MTPPPRPTTPADTGTAVSAPAAADPASSNQGMGLDLTADSPSQPKAAPTMSFDAVDVSGKSGDRQRLDVAISLFKNEEYEKAAMSSLRDAPGPKLAGLHLEARYVLAKALYRMGLYHSSLGEFSKILAVGPETKFFKTSLEWLFFISRKTKNETVILDEIARYANQEFPERSAASSTTCWRATTSCAAGRWTRWAEAEDADKSFNEVKRLTLLIPQDGPSTRGPSTSRACPTSASATAPPAPPPGARTSTRWAPSRP